MVILWKRDIVEEGYCGRGILWKRDIVEEGYCGRGILWKRIIVEREILRRRDIV